MKRLLPRTIDNASDVSSFTAKWKKTNNREFYDKKTIFGLKHNRAPSCTCFAPVVGAVRVGGEGTERLAAEQVVRLQMVTQRLEEAQHERSARGSR